MRANVCGACECVKSGHMLARERDEKASCIHRARNVAAEAAAHRLLNLIQWDFISSIGKGGFGNGEHRRRGEAQPAIDADRDLEQWWKS